MCRFYSAIVMKNGDLLHNENLMSHEDIIDFFNINDSQLNCDKFVRVEFTPDEDKDYTDIEKYKLKVDEQTIPEWFEKHREYIGSRLKEFVNTRIIMSDRKILTGGLYIVKDCIINKLQSATIVYLEATVNSMLENSTVNLMLGDSTVKEMRGNSTVNLMMGDSTVNLMLGNSTVKEMRGNSTVNSMWGNSTVNSMWGNSTVKEMRGNSTVKQNNSKNSLPEKS